MIVKTGWNTEFARDKFDVGLDETDLARILAEAGIPEAPVTVDEAFRLLLFEADHLSETYRAAKLNDHDALKAASASADRRDAVLAKVKARLGVG